MKGIVLAAGKGTRLSPLTKFVAKALLPINRKPAIEQVIELSRDCGITEMAIVIGHLGDQVKSRLGDGSKYGVKISYREQERLNGTAKALEAAGDFISGDVLVAASDCILPKEHVKELLNYHASEQCDATLSLKRLSQEEILSSAVVSLNEDGKISKIIEKPSKSELIGGTASSPYYVFKDTIVDYLHKVKPSKRGEFELQDAIQMMIDDGLKVKGLISQKWKHLSDLKALIRLNSGIG